MGAVAVFRDRTEVTNLAEALTGSRHLVEAMRAYAHEFINKLHTILGLIQLDRVEQAEQYILDVSEVHHQSVSRVMNQIEDTAVAALLVGKASRAAELGIQLQVDPRSSLSGEEHMLPSGVMVTILGNLIENATESLNHSTRKQKEIHVSILENPDGLLLCVEDTGPGILPELLPYIFEPGVSTKGEAGHGLGLVQIKDLTDLYHGQIRVESEPKSGTSIGARSYMYRTVIVEDDPMIASINQTFLSRDPRFSLAAVFHSGQEALEWLRKRPVELLILDVYMPRMSGLELLRELRAEEITLDVIMVTAANDSKTVDALLKLGVADYLVKPFTARRFQQALDTFCRQREAISAHTSVSQEDLDAMLSSGRSAAPVPKGLQLRTLARVRECLAQAPREGCTCEALSEQVGLSSVTVRRYLTYLVGRGEATSRINYDTGGRPSLLYRLSQS